MGAPTPTQHTEEVFQLKKGDSRLEVAFLGVWLNWRRKVGRAVKTAVARAQKMRIFAEVLRQKRTSAVKSAGRGVRLGRISGVLERGFRLVSRHITRLKGGIWASKGRRVERTFCTSGSEIPRLKVPLGASVWGGFLAFWSAVCDSSGGTLRG